MENFMRNMIIVWSVSHFKIHWKLHLYIILFKINVYALFFILFSQDVSDSCVVIHRNNIIQLLNDFKVYIE